MQLHWDAGAEVGAMQRLATGAGQGAPSPSPGPAGEVHAHVALIPLLRLGPYLSYDVSPVGGLPAREHAEAGLRVKVTPPLFAEPWRAWAFTGLGYARTTMGDLKGGLLELPVGVGVSYRLRRPWEVFVELGGRIGLAFAGSMYSVPQCLCGPNYAGKDSFALSLSAGVSFSP
jgi:hypothetical protein